MTKRKSREQRLYMKAFEKARKRKHRELCNRYAQMSGISLSEYLEMTEFGRMEVLDEFDSWASAYASLIRHLDSVMEWHAHEETAKHMEEMFPKFDQWVEEKCT